MWPVTAAWPFAGLPGLRIDLGEHTRPWAPDRGVWIRLPAADYQCGACGWIESASGDAVLAFVRAIRHTHAASCTKEWS